MSGIWHFITNFFNGIGDFWNWCSMPLGDTIEFLSGTDLGNWRPYELLGISGFIIVIGFSAWHLIKLIF